MRTARRSTSRKGPGAAESRGRFAEVFDAAQRRLARAPTAHCRRCCAAWWARPSAGVEAPYLPCPADLYELADDPVARARRRHHRARHALHAIRWARPTSCAARKPSCSARERLDALDRAPASSWSACLARTPSGCRCTRSVVQEFLTAPTGELFAMLCEHSVLVRDQATPIEHHAARISSAGSRRRRSIRKCSLLHRLFQSRSLRLDKQLIGRRRGFVDVGSAHRHGCRAARCRCSRTARRRVRRST